jgi:hypothetical protein
VVVEVGAVVERGKISYVVAGNAEVILEYTPGHFCLIMASACLTGLDALRGQFVRLFVKEDAYMCWGVEELNVAKTVAQGIVAISRCVDQGVVQGGAWGRFVGEEVNGELAVRKDQDWCGGGDGRLKVKEVLLKHQHCIKFSSIIGGLSNTLKGADMAEWVTVCIVPPDNHSTTRGARVGAGSTI